MNNTLWLFLIGPWEWMTAKSDTVVSVCVCLRASGLFLITSLIMQQKEVTLTQYKKSTFEEMKALFKSQTVRSLDS